MPAVPTPAPGTCLVRSRYQINRGPDNSVTTHVFDAAGNLTRSVTASEQCTLAGFDTGCASAQSETVYVYEQGRLTERKTTDTEDGKSRPAASFSYEYDANGRLIKQTQFDPSGRRFRVYAFRYDAKGALSGRSLDRYGDGKFEIEETFKTKRDATGKLLELRYERTKPKPDLKNREALGVVSKVTNYTYDSSGRLTGAKTSAKFIDLDTSKPVKNHIYPLKRAEESLSSSYQTDADGAIKGIVFCRDPQDQYSCTTTTLTLASQGAGEKWLVQQPFESSGNELFGDCRFEEVPPLEGYAAPGSSAGVHRGSVDDFSFRMAFGKRNATTLTPATP